MRQWTRLDQSLVTRPYCSCSRPDRQGRRKRARHCWWLVSARTGDEAGKLVNWGVFAGAGQLIVKGEARDGTGHANEGGGGMREMLSGTSSALQAGRYGRRGGRRVDLNCKKGGNTGVQWTVLETVLDTWAKVAGTGKEKWGLGGWI